MVFVTLGTQDKPFPRLLEAVEKLIIEGVIKDKVIVQAGCTKFQSSSMEIFDLLPKEEFDSYLDACSLLITHGGVGSIVGGLKRKKPVIAIARLAKYKEHVNDHQTQIIDSFIEKHYIVGARSIEELKDAIKKAKKFKAEEYESNTKNMIALVQKYIEE